MVRYVLAALLISGSLTSVDATRQDTAPTSDDREVFTAILEHTIRPEVARLSTMANIPGTPLLIVLDQTSSMCQGTRDRTRQICVSVDDIENVRTPTRIGALMGGSAYGSVLRSALVAAFISRNARSERFPTLEEAGVVLVPYAGVQESLKAFKRETVGYSAFSLPGYSDDGHAVVFGFYTCGGLCGRGMLFLLARTSGKWHVEVASTLWMS